MKNIFRRNFTSLTFPERFVRTSLLLGTVTFVTEFFFFKASDYWVYQGLLSLVFAVWTSLVFAVSEHLVARGLKGTNSSSQSSSSREEEQ